MALNHLMDCLKQFTEDTLKDMVLPVKQENWTEQPLVRKIDVYKYMPPTHSDRKELVPYIMFQPLAGADEEDSQTHQRKSTLTVRGYIATFNYDGQQGQLSLVNIIERMRQALLTTGMIGDKYELELPFEYRIYDDNVSPYHEAEFVTSWSIPVIQRRTPELWDYFKKEG